MIPHSFSSTGSIKMLLAIAVTALMGTAAYLAREPVAAGSSEARQEQVEVDFEQTWKSLNEKWLAHLGGPGWVYYAFRADLAGDNGVDINVGWPLPNRSLDENWFNVDENGRIRVVLTRRTDLERGNVWLASWRDNLLVLHYPHQNLEMEDESWTTLELAISPMCVSYGKPARSLTLELLGDEEPPLYVATLTITYSELRYSGGPVEGYYWGQEMVCKRDVRDGTPVSVEQTLIGKHHERIFLARMYDYRAEHVPSPPAEMLSLLDER